MLAAGYAFYAWWDPPLPWLLALVSVLPQGGALWVERASDERRRKRRTAVAALTFLLPLGMVQVLRLPRPQPGERPRRHRRVGPFAAPPDRPAGRDLLYTFMAMSYVVDVSRWEVTPAPWLDVFAYLAFFPPRAADRRDLRVPVDRAGGRRSSARPRPGPEGPARRRARVAGPRPAAAATPARRRGKALTSRRDSAPGPSGGPNQVADEGRWRSPRRGGGAPAAPRPDGAFVMLGSNDNQAQVTPDGETVPVGSHQWVNTYREHAAAFLHEATSAGTRVVWWASRWSRSASGGTSTAG
jgi:hypothetical protein